MMPIKVNYKFSISKDVKHLIQSGHYEEFICEIMNASSIVFPNSYEHISNQSNNECDFVDKNTGERFDAKLIHTKEECISISVAKDIQSFLTMCFQLNNEFTSHLRDPNFSCKDLELFKRMKEQFEKMKEDENLILFSLFPLVNDIEGSMFFSGIGEFGNILKTCFNEMKEDLKGRTVYAVFPSTSGEFIVADLLDNTSEYVINEKLARYISIEMVGWTKE